MPSPSPSSRRSHSPIGPRGSTPGAASRRELAPRGIHLGQSSSFNSSMSRGMPEKIIESKENSSQCNIASKPRIKVSQNADTPSKKPWSQHFVKVNSTPVPSPNTRVLGERNSSRSPVRSTSTRGNINSLCDKKPNAASHIHTDVTSPAPKGVAELSKRIQQFLEDQESLVGARPTTPRVNEGLAATTEHADPFSPPYDPYNSPFSERPKFLRLCGSTPIAMDPLRLDAMEVSDNLFNTTQIETKDSVPAEHVEAEVEDGEIIEDTVMLDQSDNFTEMESENPENTEMTPEVETVTGKINPPISEAHANLVSGMHLEESKEKESVNVSSDQIYKHVNADVPVPTVVQPEDPPTEIKSISETVPHVENPSLDENDTDADNYSSSAKPSFVRRVVGNIAIAAFVAAFISIVLLASDSPGLLPSNFRNNSVSCALQKSIYYDPSISFLRSFDALWSGTDSYYSPSFNGNDILKSMNKLSSSIKSSYQTYFHLAHHALSETWLMLSQRWSSVNNKIDTPRQFERIHDHDFPNSLEDKDSPTSSGDCDLLNEYDLLSPNHVITGSISESVPNDLDKSTSQPSDSSQDQGVLKEIMDIEGGITSEDTTRTILQSEEPAGYSFPAVSDLLPTNDENEESLIQPKESDVHEFVELDETSSLPTLESCIHEVPESDQHSEQSSSALKDVLTDQHLLLDDGDKAVIASKCDALKEQLAPMDDGDTTAIALTSDVPKEGKSEMDINASDVLSMSCPLLNAHYDFLDGSEQSLEMSDNEQEQENTKDAAYSMMNTVLPDHTPSISDKEEQDFAVESTLKVQNENADELMEKTTNILADERLSDVVPNILNDQSESPLKEMSSSSRPSGENNTALNFKMAAAIGGIMLSFATGLFVLSTLNKSKLKASESAATNVQFLRKSELQQSEFPLLSKSSVLSKKAEVQNTVQPTEATSIRNEEAPKKKFPTESPNVNFLNKTVVSQSEPTSASKYSMRIAQSYPEQMLSQSDNSKVFSEVSTFGTPRVFSETSSPRVFSEASAPRVFSDASAPRVFSEANAQRVFSEVTMIEDLNGKLPSVLKTPESTAKLSNLSRQSSVRSLVGREDDDLTRSPAHVSSSSSSPYGSITTYERVAKKERSSDVKLTPVRRSSRLRNQAVMSPDPSSVRRVAISPP